MFIQCLLAVWVDAVGRLILLTAGMFAVSTVDASAAM